MRIEARYCGRSGSVCGRMLLRMLPDRGIVDGSYVAGCIITYMTADRMHGEW